MHHDNWQVGVITVYWQMTQKCYEGSLKNSRSTYLSQPNKEVNIFDLDPRIAYGDRHPIWLTR